MVTWGVYKYFLMKKEHLTNLKLALLGLETTVARPSSKTYAKLGLDNSWYLGLALSCEVKSKANGLGNIKTKIKVYFKTNCLQLLFWEEHS